MSDLETAIKQRHVDEVQSLLRKGRNPNHTNSVGNTPLMELLEKGYTELDLGYNIRKAQPGHRYNSNYETNESENDNDTNNTNNNNDDESNGKKIQTPFDILFHLLLPLTDLSIKNKVNETALSIAVNEKLKSQVAELITAGADITHKYKDNSTILHNFVSQHNADKDIRMFQSICRFADSALLDVKNDDGYTALDMAIVYGNYLTAEHLLYKGATLTEFVRNYIHKTEKNDPGFFRLQEVVEHLLKKNDVLPDIQPQDVEVLFGTELEICVKLTPECAEEASTKRKKPAMFQDKKWVELFSMFAKFILSKSPLAETMRKRYGFMYVSGGKKYGANYILNLSNFLIEQMPKSVEVSYDKPFFTIDRSVVCADFQVKPGYNDPKPKYMPDIEETFHIELVSPILTKMDELKELLEFLGMKKTGCFVANDTAGFHVNVSLRNKKTMKPIPLTSDFFTRTFFPRYKVWEAEVYPKVRPEINMSYAKCIGDTNSERFPELYHKICSHKYVSVHRKTPRELVEFRLFGSSANMSDLLKYTEMSTEFLRNAYIEWHSFYKPAILLKQTGHAILKKQQNLQKTLQTIQSQLRTRKTKGLLSKRTKIQQNLRSLATLTEKNAKTRLNALKALTAHRTPTSKRSVTSKHSKTAKVSKTRKNYRK